MTHTVRKTKEFWTPRERTMASLDQGRRPGRLPGGHVTDIADLKKAIMLCDDCKPKFASANAGYVTRASLPFVRGRCDGCSQYTNRAHLFVHHSTIGR